MKNSSEGAQGRNCDGLYKKRGIWYFRVKDWTGKLHAISTRTRNYNEARKIQAERTKLAEEGQPIEVSRARFRDVAEAWEKRKKLEVSSGTSKVYSRVVRTACKYLGDIPMGAINAQILRRYQLERGKTVSATTINLETRMIGGILRENQMWRRIAPNFRQLHEHCNRGRALTPHELRKLLEAAGQRPSVIEPVIKLILETGMRHKEVRTLRLGNIDLDRRILRIQRDGTKTAAGERWIPLTDDACETLKILIKRAKSLGAFDEKHYLFPSPRNYKGEGSGLQHDPTIPQTSFTGAWWAVRSAAGLDKTLRLHDLRHHVATDMAAAGVPSGVAMKLLGWSTPRMRERYEHLQDRSLRVGIEQLEAMRASMKKRPEQEEHLLHADPAA